MSWNISKHLKTGVALVNSRLVDILLLEEVRVEDYQRADAYEAHSGLIDRIGRRFLQPL